MSFFVIFTVGGGGLFFAGILLLLILEGATNLASERILAFIDGHLIAIGIFLGIVVVLVTIFATRVYQNDSSDSKKYPLWFAIGVFLNTALAAVNLLLYTRAPFTSIYNGWLLLIFRVIIAIVIYVIYICITNFLLSCAIEGKLYMLYFSPVIGALFLRFALTSW